MRATRGYLASLGTTGLLVLAAFAILITASALLAFNGWPGDEAPDRATPVLIDPGRELAAGTGPAEVAAEAADVADGVAFVPASAGGEGGGGSGPAGDGNGPGDDVDPDDPGDGDPDDGTPDIPADPSPPGGGDPPPTDVSLTDGLADGVESTTDFLGANAVSPVSPELGQVVIDTGRALIDLVRALDGTPAAARR